MNYLFKQMVDRYYTSHFTDRGTKADEVKSLEIVHLANR